MSASYQVPAEPTGPQAPAAQDQRPAHLQGTDFKDEAALRAAYDALRSKMSKEGAPKPDAPPAPEAPPSPEKPPEQKPGEQQQQQQQADTQTFKALEAAGLKPADYTAELQQNGALSQKSYDALAEKGFPKEVVDAYIRGLGYDPKAGAKLQIEQQHPEVAEAKKIIAQQQVEAIVASVGGEEEYSAMAAWAQANQDKVDLKAYNAAVSSGDKVRAEMAVKWLHGKYQAANGKEPATRINGGAAQAAVDAYESWDQVTRDMRDPRYKAGDPAFIRAVQQKLKVSKL